MRAWIFVAALGVCLALETGRTAAHERLPAAWWYHYGLYSPGKIFKHAGPFSTLEACLQFVSQGPWASSEHCDVSKW